MTRPSDETIKNFVTTHGGYRPAARALQKDGWDITESSIRRLFDRVNSDEGDFEVQLPGGAQAAAIDVKELIERRKTEYSKRREVYLREKMIPIGVRMDGPIGLGFMGDPHLDDDGTDLAEIFRHVELFDGRNEGLYAGNMGDLTNNWIGKLARLWAEQSTSAAEARAIAEEFLGRIKWLFYIHGNHDMWGGGNDLINAIINSNVVVRKDHKIRLGLKLPSGRNVKIFASHRPPGGRSMWSEVYGTAKFAQLDGTHDIYASAHIHTSGYAHGWHDGNQVMWHAIQVASYKKMDRYAEELNLPPKDLYTCPVALIDPDATNPVNFIRWEFDPHEGAERLRWMRARWRAGQSAS